MTNVIESLHLQRRAIIRMRGRFPSDEATTELLRPVLRNASA